MHQHSLASRRVTYGAVATVMVLAFHGSRALQGADRVAPVLFAAAAGFCAVAAVRARSYTMWMLSGVAVCVSFAWRRGQLVAIELALTSQEPPDSASMAVAAYLFCLLAAPALWRWRLWPGLCCSTSRVDDE